MSHKNLSDQINLNLAMLGGKDGIDLSKIQAGTVVRFRTRNSLYICERYLDGTWIVQGGAFFPTKTFCRINGSTWGGSMIKVDYMGIGMHVEFVALEGPHKGVITTTAIREFVLPQEGRA